VTGLSVVGNDITEQTRAEESIRRLATIVRDSNDAVTIQDFEGHILAWNRGAERNYGYSQEEAVGMNVDAILPETEREATRRLYASFKEGANCDSFETKRLTRDGRCLDVWMTASILADDQGVPVAICTTERDITQRNRHLAALREAAERFARSNQDLDRFASMVSHDLNEPLRTIVGFCKLLATEHGGNMADPAREYIDRIQSAGRRMQRQIADLLEFSRLAGQEFERRPTDLNQLLGKVVETLSAGLAECGGTVSWGNLPTLCISESLLGQVFQNLIDNAIKYRRDEPPRVQVAALRVDDGWQVSVQDNGLGILPEHFAKVFEPFRRLHRAAESPGSGMGLAISKRIVERLGGRIWVESQYGQGSTFLVMLPDGSQSHHEPSASSSSVGG
jgi:PAS domain S-box-containing protein